MFHRASLKKNSVHSSSIKPLQQKEKEKTACVMDRSIRYVREHKVAPLLNDMLTHLLVTQSVDPLTTLISYLEKRHAHLPSSITAAATTSSPLPGASACNQQDATSDPSQRSLPADEKGLLHEILSSESRAQLGIERAAAAAPKSAASLRTEIDRFVKNSQRITQLVESLLVVASTPPVPTDVPFKEVINELRDEACRMSAAMDAWIAGGRPTFGGTLDGKSVDRALQQHAQLTALLTELAT